MNVNLLNRRLRRIVRDERGTTIVEFGLIVALVAVLAASGATVLGHEIGHVFSDANATLLVGGEGAGGNANGGGGGNGANNNGRGGGWGGGVGGGQGHK